jgi:hypothetical protein
MNPRRRRFLPKPEQPPEGMVYAESQSKGLTLITTDLMQKACAYRLQMAPVPSFRNDPSYNWNRKHGRTRTPR